MIHRRIRQAAGVALVTAIFLLVVLAGLAVAVVSLMTTQQSAQQMDEMGVRAYQAAKAGMEWAVYRQLQPVALAACPNVTSFQLPPGTSLSSFTVTITCTQAAGPLPNHFELVVVACNQPTAGACPNANPGPDYVQRELRAQL